jgi:microcystin-dependent protein
MSDPFLGEIRMVGFNFAPNGWALCSGQVMPVSQNTALFSLLGKTFGGDGVQTFGLPDLQGRSPVGVGGGSGLTPITWGQKSGTETVTLTQNQMPAHNHPAQFTGQATPVSGSATTTVAVAVGTGTASAMVAPAAGATTYLSATTAKAGLTNVTFNGLYTGTAPDSTKANLGGVSATTALASASSTAAGSIAVGIAGASQPTPLRNPYLGVTFVIAMEGIYPPRP